MNWKDEIKKATTSKIKISSELKQYTKKMLEDLIDSEKSGIQVKENVDSEYERLEDAMELRQVGDIDDELILMAAIEQVIEKMIKDREDDDFRRRAEFEGDY